MRKPWSPRAPVFEDIRFGTDGCVLCDDLQRYPEILASLRANPSRLGCTRQGGARVRQAYDYRVVYRPYLECIDRFLAAAS